MFGRNKKTNATKTENCSNCGSSRTKDSACKRSCSKSSSKRSSKN